MKTHPPRTLEQWLKHIEQLHPSEIDLGLQRVRIVAEKLKLLSPAATVITVAGTNGKGSCIASMEALFTAANKRVGAYTSPHLLRYNERVRINGQEVDDQSLCDAFTLIDKARASVSLTYFEYGTLAALLIFKQQPLDYWLLEVGLGGRLDAVNIVDADIAIFTPIDIDHQAYLGDNREEIAIEKAGILRPAQTVICADDAPPNSLSEAITANTETAFYIGRDFDAENGIDDTVHLRGILSRNEVMLLSKPKLPLASVLAATKAFALCLPDACNASILTPVYRDLTLAGRMQSVFGLSQKGKALQFILDVAHNPHSIGYLVRSLRDIMTTGTQVAAVVGMLSDKDKHTALASLLPVASHWYLPPLLNTPRAASPQAMRQCLLNLDVPDCKITPCKGMSDALLLAAENESWQRVEAQDLPTSTSIDQYILVVGSFYTVAQATTVLRGD